MPRTRKLLVDEGNNFQFDGQSWPGDTSPDVTNDGHAVASLPFDINVGTGLIDKLTVWENGYVSLGAATADQITYETTHFPPTDLSSFPGDFISGGYSDIHSSAGTVSYGTGIVDFQPDSQGNYSMADAVTVFRVTWFDDSGSEYQLQFSQPKGVAAGDFDLAIIQTETADEQVAFKLGGFSFDFSDQSMPDYIQFRFNAALGVEQAGYVGTSDPETFKGGDGSEILTGLGGDDHLSGGGGNDTLNGGDDNDTLDGGDGQDILLPGAGDDIVTGDAGPDVINAGASFHAADQFDGGVGTDSLVLKGDYSGGVVFNATTLTNVEKIQLAGGFSYTLTSADATVAAGASLTVDGSALGASDVLIFDGSAETDGKLILDGGAGKDVLTGGAGSDTLNGNDGRDTLAPGPGQDIVNGGAGPDLINMGAYLSAGDRIDGGVGTDLLTLKGDYSAGVTFNATTVVNVETIHLAAGFSYKLTSADATVASGQTLTVDGSALAAANKVIFNGAAETNGSFVLAGGAGGDTLTGGAKADTLTGGFGGDVLTGGKGADHLLPGSGNDVLVYAAATDSSSTAYDTIDGFAFNSDKLNIPGSGTPVTGIDAALTTGTLSTASFDANLTSALSGDLGAHHAELFTPNAGTLSGQTFLVVDLNGTAGYQANADLVIHLTGQTGTLVIGDFI